MTYLLIAVMAGLIALLSLLESGRSFYEKNNMDDYWPGYDDVPTDWNGRTIVLVTGLPPLVGLIKRIRTAFPCYRFVVYNSFLHRSIVSYPRMGSSASTRKLNWIF